MLPSRAFSHCLTVLEFLQSYGKVLGFDPSRDVPSLSTLQEGLLGVGGSAGAVQDLLVRLLQAALYDPGLPPYCQVPPLLCACPLPCPRVPPSPALMPLVPVRLQLLQAWDGRALHFGTRCPRCSPIWERPSPGFGCPPRVVPFLPCPPPNTSLSPQSLKILGEKVSEISLNRDTVSEVLRCFLTAHGAEAELCTGLRTKPFQALLPERKAAILAFLVNELNSSARIIR